MARVKRKISPYAHAHEEAKAAQNVPDTPQTRSDSYKLSYLDNQFILRDDLRPVRLQLELLKPELIQQELGIESTVIFFGSARTLDNETALKELEKV